MEKRINRRSFLRVAGLTGLALSTGNALAANSSEQQDYKIDVHHHIIPPIYTNALAKIGITETNGAPFPKWSPEQSINMMDRNGINAAITSISAPGIYFGNSAFTADLAKRCNDYSANLVAKYPTRFGAFAVLPLPDIDAALKAIEYALDSLKLDGVVLLTNINGQYIGNPDFYDVYEELNIRKATVYVHPTEPAKGKFPDMPLPPSFLEFMFDTTRAVATMVQYRTMERFPGIRFIVSHAGGAAPYLTWKMSLIARYSYGNDSNVIRNLQSLYYDTALSTSVYSLDCLQKLVGSSHILFGSDYPFAPEIVTSNSIFDLKSYQGFDDKGRMSVNSGNALNLFPRLKVEN